MPFAALDHLAESLYERHNFDPRTPVTPHRLARKEFGADVIVRPRFLIGHRPAQSGWVAGKARITLRATVPEDEESFYVGHELAHLVLGERHDSRNEDLEARCDYLGAAFMAPRPAMRELFRRHGWNVQAIAHEVLATQTWAALRLAETIGSPLAAVSPQTIRVRGADWSWPDEPEIRRQVHRPGPGLQKVRITDRPGRAALVVND